MNKKRLIDLLESYNSVYEDEIQYKNLLIDFLNRNDIFLGKKNSNGHITGSAWIISKDRENVLLTHHRKLDKWLQLGGHTEEGETILESALREAVEESGLSTIQLFSMDVFDIDVHLIPARENEKEHYHYDIRFIMEADKDEKVEISSESKDLKWVSLNKIVDYSKSRSLLRMVEKTNKIFY